MGPMTGRAAGFCAGNAAPGFAAWGAGPGYAGGFGRGGGRGRRYRYYATGLTGRQRAGFFPWGAPAAPENELEALKSQARAFQGALDGILKRIDELGSRSPESPE